MDSDQRIAGGELEATVTTPLLADSALGERRKSGQEPEWPGQTDYDGVPAWRKPSIFWLLPPFLLFTLAFGGIVVPKLNLIKDLLCRDYYADRALSDPTFTYIPISFGGAVPNEQCRIPEVQSRATQFMLIGGVVGGLLSAITSPKLGSLSDRYGRLRIIAITSLGPLTGEIITIIAATNPDTFVVNWLYLGFVLDGLSGSFISGMALSHAYASDCTPPSLRNVAFGYFHGVLFTGIAIGPLIAGLVVKATGALLSMFYIALAFHLFFLFCLVFIIPESLSKPRQQAAREKYAQRIAKDRDPNSTTFSRIRTFNPFEPLKILYPKGPGTSPELRRNLILLSAVDTTMFGVAMGSMTVAIYYSEFEFDWGTPQQSFFLSTVNICRVTCLFVILPGITRLVRGRATNRRSQPQNGCDKLDLGIIRTAVFFDTLGYLGYTVVRSSGLFVLSGCIASLGGIGSPTLQSAITKHVPHDRVGQVLGANGLLHALARVVAPAIFNGVYSVTVGKYTQAVFLCLTIGFATAAVLSWGLRAGVYLDPAEEERRASAAYPDGSWESRREADTLAADRDL